MGQLLENDPSDEAWHRGATIDWPDMMRLGLIVSAFAAATALVLVGHLSETAIVVSVIVLATMASWFHLEHGRFDSRQARPARVPSRVHRGRH